MMNILKNIGQKYSEFKQFLAKPKVSLTIALVSYILWVIWVGNYWLLMGIPIVYDIYISKKVNWSFWKKREGKNHRVIEWIDALIFAVLAVTFINIFFFQNYKIPTGSMEKSLLKGDHLFVSKIAYGPRIPNTPIHFPFAQHTLPGTQKTPSFVTWVQWPYKRLAGLKTIKRNDPVVFNFPAGDTVVVQMQAEAYESILRRLQEELVQNDLQRGIPLKTMDQYQKISREYIWNNYDVVVRPIDKRDNYIKRCVAIPGDTLEIINTDVFINGKPQQKIPHLQYRYQIVTNGARLNPKNLEKIGIPEEDIDQTYDANTFIAPLTNYNVSDLKKLPNIISVTRIIKPKGQYSSYIFPHSPEYPWNDDNFGPIILPKKGMKIQLTLINLAIYERAIRIYENNSLEIKDNKIFINGKETSEYTFKMDYYWMMGDNRHDSADSRFWGFVPEDHIVGKPVFVWLSMYKGKIRFNRMFMGIK